jgi:S-(hydroxymethyl)glutathione dehydrogenase/alcohol dehydrogenase
MTKAAVLYDFHQALRIEDVELKRPRDDEIIVKIAASGVCHSDLSVVRGALPFPPPVVLGHEGAGIVEEVGRSVTELKPGDHVLLAWVANCGHCHFCRKGASHLCSVSMEAPLTGEDLVFEKDGVSIARLAGVGSFAERTVVRAGSAIKIPESVPLERACLIGCGVMTGVGAAVNTANVRPGETVAVFGCGGIGLNIIQGAALCGAASIIAIDRIPAKLELARTFGATDTIDSTSYSDVVAAIHAHTDGLGVDHAFEAVGSPALIREALACVQRGGQLIVVGVPSIAEEVSIPGISLAFEGKSILGCLYGSANVRRDMPRLIDLYQRGRLKLDELVSREIGLDEVNDAFGAIDRGEVARTVVRFP